MDVEMSEEPVASSSTSTSTKLVIGTDSPFDLEAVMANYSGRDLVTRLQFAASRSHSIAGPALKMAMDHVKQSTLDVTLYEQLHAQYTQFVNSLQAGLVHDPVAITWAGNEKELAVPLDKEWIQKASRERDNSIQKLEVELKGYQTNLIRESIRMGHRDLARMQERCGNLTGAVSSYQKSKENCVNNEQILELCLAIIQVSLELRNYMMLRNWTVKAEGQLETLSQAPQKGKQKTQAVNLPGMQATVDPAQLAKDKERQATADRLAVAAGIAYLGTAAYEKAARSFTSVSTQALESSKGQLVPPSDIALYAVLTSLASFSRSQVRHSLLENANMRPFLDAEPYLRDVLRAYETNDFKRTFDLLDSHSARQHLDVHLSAHVSPLLSQIRTRALLTYFTPFASLSLDKFASAFGTTSDQLVPVLVDLITNDKMQAQIDLIDGTVVKKNLDPRNEAFVNAVERGDRIERDVRASRFRMRLVEEGLIVKAASSSSSGRGGASRGGGGSKKKEEDVEDEDEIVE